MDKRFCPRCGAEWNSDKDLFCSQCGLQFHSTKARKKLLVDIADIENAPNPYEALRFTSSIIIALGWTIIVVGWGLALFLYGGMVQTFREFVTVQNGPLFNMASAFFIIMIWAFIAVVGVSVIASGQIFLVLLDLRNDTYATMRLVRRFGLLMSEEK